MAELTGIQAYTLEDFIRSFRPDGLGHIIIEDFEGIVKDIAFDEVLCDLCNAEIVQPEDEPFKVTVFVMDGYALCEECMHRVEDEGEEPSLLYHARKRGGKPMSRCYELVVTVKGITQRQLYSVMFAGFKWAEVSAWTDEDTNIVQGTYEGSLYWQSTDEAHMEIADAIKRLNPLAKVSTRWTWLENLPCVEHGDIDGEAEASPHAQHLKGGESKWDLRK